MVSAQLPMWCVITLIMQFESSDLVSVDVEQFQRAVTGFKVILDMLVSNGLHQVPNLTIQ